MELYQLRYFQAVAEFGTLAKAAEDLAVSQSAVSRAISLLEKEIGVELFTRRGRANELNRFGKAFLDTSRAAQRGIDTAVASVRQLAGADGGTVALGFLHSLGVATVPSLIRWHHDRFPSVSFELHQRSGQALLTDLSAGVTDVCLNYPMAFDETLDIKWEPLFTQQLYAVVDRAHPLATRGSVGFDELADQRFVALNREHTLRRIFDDACVRHGVTPTIAFEGTDIATLRGLIGARLGIAILPRASTPSRDVVEIAVDDDHLVRPIAIGWMVNRFLPPSASSFRDSALAWRRTRNAPQGSAQPARRTRVSNAQRKRR
jgi:LysR family transcriptional regulator, transcription activator of glutamate synthase operon